MNRDRATGSTRWIGKIGFGQPFVKDVISEGDTSVDSDIKILVLNFILINHRVHRHDAEAGAFLHFEKNQNIGLDIYAQNIFIYLEWLSIIQILYPFLLIIFMSLMVFVSLF
jgi:hypothetical protein